MDGDDGVCGMDGGGDAEGVMGLRGDGGGSIAVWFVMPLHTVAANRRVKSLVTYCVSASSSEVSLTTIDGDGDGDGDGAFREGDREGVVGLKGDGGVSIAL